MSKCTCCMYVNTFFDKICDSLTVLYLLLCNVNRKLDFLEPSSRHKTSKRIILARFKPIYMGNGDVCVTYTAFQRLHNATQNYLNIYEVCLPEISPANSTAVYVVNTTHDISHGCILNPTRRRYSLPVWSHDTCTLIAYKT